MKKRLNDEGANQLLTNCKQLRMTAEDGKKRKKKRARPTAGMTASRAPASPVAVPLYSCAAPFCGGQQKAERCLLLRSAHCFVVLPYSPLP
jgi:hypothetical protein